MGRGCTRSPGRQVCVLDRLPRQRTGIAIYCSQPLLCLLLMCSFVLARPALMVPGTLSSAGDLEMRFCPQGTHRPLIHLFIHSFRSGRSPGAPGPGARVVVT